MSLQLGNTIGNTTCHIYGNKYVHRYVMEYDREGFTTMSMMIEKRVLPEALAVTGPTPYRVMLPTYGRPIKEYGL